MLQLEKLNHQSILEKMIQISKEPLLLFDSQGSIILVNEAFENVYGWKAEEVLGSKRIPFIQNFLQYEEDILVAAIANKQQLDELEAKHITMQGYTITVQLSLSLVPYNAQDIGSLLIIKDITGREAIQQAIENSSEAILIHHEEKIIYLNKACCMLLGQAKREEVMGKNILSYIHEQDTSFMLERVNKFFKGEELDSIHIKIKTTEGIRTVNISPFPVLYKGIHCTQIAMRDVTEQEEYRAKLEKWAFHDALTGLPNRRYFMKKAQDTLNNAQKNGIHSALLIIDCDNFKQINDKEGHLVGDQVLIHIGNTLQKLVRSSDIITRIGGDEFIVLLNHINHIEEGQDIAMHILKALDTSWLVHGMWIKTTVSIGGIFNEQYQQSLADLFHKADQALYRSKKEGSNSCTFY